MDLMIRAKEGVFLVNSIDKSLKLVEPISTFNTFAFFTPDGTYLIVRSYLSADF